MRNACQICEVAPEVFTVIFGDKSKFNLCEGCTDDICLLQEWFFLDMTIMILQDAEDPAEFLPFSTETDENFEVPTLSPDWPINW